MSDQYLGEYDPGKVQLIINNVHHVTGFADGTFITAERYDKEIRKMHVGAKGEVSTTLNNNITGYFKFVLKATSPSNRYLDKLKYSPVKFPILLKDNSSVNDMAGASTAWVKEEPTREKADEESMVEWIIDCADYHSSNL